MSTVSNSFGKHTVVRSATREVVIGSDQPFCLIGERLNPTGRKIFAEQLRRGDLSRIAIDVEQQVAGGATMLDINMGVPLADEAELLAKAVTLVQELTDLPLCIDSSVVEALEAGLAAYQGKALVNSITGERERMDQILPMAMQCGLTSAIMDVRAPQIVEAVKAADLLLGNDEWGAAWIARSRAAAAAAKAAAEQTA